MIVKLSTDKSRLIQKPELWDFNNPPLDIVELSIAMVNFVYEKNALGVAYNQLDLPGNYSLFAMRNASLNRAEKEEDKMDYVCINPKIVKASSELITLSEACLSFPGLKVDVERPRHVRVRFSGPDGKVYTKQFDNLQARIFQHEFDHTQGKVFWESVSKLKFDMALKHAIKNGSPLQGITYKKII